MHISITDNLKKRFHATCALKGLKMSQVVNELIEQWLEKQHSSSNWSDKKQEAVVKLDGLVISKTTNSKT
jgi:ParG